MIPSELGEIPEGWSSEKVKDFIEIRNGYAFKSGEYQEYGMPVVRTTNFNNGTIDLNDTVYLSHENAKNYSKFQLSKFDILVVMVGASIGKTVITPSKVLPGLQNQNMWNFLSLSSSRKFYDIGLVERLIRTNAASASGSARDFFRKDHFYQLDSLKPRREITDNYNALVKNLYKKKDINLTQIQTLTHLRDTLLPKLMKGEIRIKNL